MRVGAIQAIYNAQAYCRNFDQMNGPQQMAMAQLVYQMGVNLEHFNAFLTTINPGRHRVARSCDGSRSAAAAADSRCCAGDAGCYGYAGSRLDQSPEYWLGVQKSLMGSQWAHKYRTRAISVIAMLDPAYSDDPTAAEKRVGAVSAAGGGASAEDGMRLGRGRYPRRSIAAGAERRSGLRRAAKNTEAGVPECQRCVLCLHLLASQLAAHVASQRECRERHASDLRSDAK